MTTTSTRPADGPPHTHDHTHDRTHDRHPDPVALARLLDLDGTVLRDYWSAVTAWVRAHGSTIRHGRILDLGAGTGTGTVALAHLFGAAEVVALDVSQDMLARVRTSALHLGLAPRVRTVRADLDAPWPPLGPVDLVWASMSLHETADPAGVLAQARSVLRPGGLVAVAEMDAPVRFLPDDVGVGRPGLEQRCLDVLAASTGHAVPMGADWGPVLESAGLTVADRRTFQVAVDPAPGGLAGEYARGWLAQLRPFLAGRLDADDVAALDALLDDAGPHAVLSRDDLALRGTRTAWLARR